LILCSLRGVFFEAFCNRLVGDVGLRRRALGQRLLAASGAGGDASLLAPAPLKAARSDRLLADFADGIGRRRGCMADVPFQAVAALVGDDELGGLDRSALGGFVGVPRISEGLLASTTVEMQLPQTYYDAPSCSAAPAWSMRWTVVREMP
jgi:hypothetical protein